MTHGIPAFSIDGAPRALPQARRPRRGRLAHRRQVAAFLDAADELRRIALVYHGALEAVAGLPDNADATDARYLAADALRAIDERLAELPPG
jgi:hypothetical protein